MFLKPLRIGVGGEHVGKEDLLNDWLKQDAVLKFHRYQQETAHRKWMKKLRDQFPDIDWRGAEVNAKFYCSRIFFG